MWRWHWKKYGGRRTGKILLDSAASIDKWRSVLFLWGGAFLGVLFISTPLGNALMSTWHLLPWWTVPVFLLVSLVILFVRGLVKANYEEFRGIEAEKEALEQQAATEERREGLRAVLVEALKDGQKLFYSNSSPEEAEKWGNTVYVVVDAALGQSEADYIFVDTQFKAGHVPLGSPHRIWLGHRLERLQELIPRVDTLSNINPDFNGYDYIVPD